MAAREDWFDEVRRQLSERQDSLCILVMGRAGTGKSALVNSIVGEYVAIEGDSPSRETTRVSKHERKFGAHDKVASHDL